MVRHEKFITQLYDILADYRFHLIGLAVLTFGLGIRGTIFFHPDSILGSALRAIVDRGNPHFFHYPALMLYIDGLVYVLIYFGLLLAGSVHSAAEFEMMYRSDRLPGGVPFLLPAQWTTVLFSVVGILGVYLVTYRLFRIRWVALSSAGIVTTSLFWVQQSHYPTVDIPLTTLILLSLVLAERALETNDRRDWVLCGLIIGLATSAKYSAAILLLPLTIVTLRLPTKPQSIRGILLCGLTSAIVFAVTNPYMFLEWQEFMADFTFDANKVRVGQLGYYTDNALLYNLLVTFPNTLGMFLIILAGVGIIRFVATHPWTPFKILFAGFILSYSVILWSSRLSFERHALPLFPPIAIFSVYGIAMFWEESAKWLKPIWLSHIARGMLLLMLIFSLATNLSLSLWHNYLLTQPDTRVVLMDLFDRLKQSNLVICAGHTISGYATWRGYDIHTIDLNQKTTDCDVILLDSFSYDRYLYDPHFPRSTQTFTQYLKQLNGYRSISLSPFSIARADVPFASHSVYSPALPELPFRILPGPYVAIFARDAETLNQIEKIVRTTVKDLGMPARVETHTADSAEQVFRGFVTQ